MVYEDKRIGENLVERVFNKNTTQDDLKWHRDEFTREVTVLKSKNWMFQRDNRFPKILKPGDNFIIRAGKWHRIIKGIGKLKIIIKTHKSS